MSVSNPLPSAEDLTTFARIAAFISDEKRRMAALDDTQKAIAAYNDAIAANAAKIEAAQVELEKLERVRQAADAHAADLAAREAKLAEGQRVLAEATAALNEENVLNVVRAKELAELSQALDARASAVQKNEAKAAALSARDEALRQKEIAYENRVAALHQTIGGILGTKEGA